MFTMFTTVTGRATAALEVMSFGYPMPLERPPLRLDLSDDVYERG
jgi:hypothetical protein